MSAPKAPLTALEIEHAIGEVLGGLELLEWALKARLNDDEEHDVFVDPIVKARTVLNTIRRQISDGVRLKVVGS